MCDIWLAIDYLNSNAAVLNMLIISFDRYFSVTRPLTYRAKRTTKHAILMISFAWILSLTIWTPAIFTYPYYKGRTVQGTDKCEIEFVKANTYLTFVTAILAFYIPVAIMIYLYWRIWLETKKRYRDLTTLFLVSGVGAAAPSRPTRPPPSSLTSSGGAAGSSSTVGLYAASGKNLARSLGARLVGSHESTNGRRRSPTTSPVAAKRPPEEGPNSGPATARYNGARLSPPARSRPATSAKQAQAQSSEKPSEKSQGVACGNAQQTAVEFSRPSSGAPRPTDKEAHDQGDQTAPVQSQEVKSSDVQCRCEPCAARSNRSSALSQPPGASCRLCQQDFVIGPRKRNKSNSRTNCCCCYSTAIPPASATAQPKSRSTKNCFYCADSANPCCCNYSSSGRAGAMKSMEDIKAQTKMNSTPGLDQSELAQQQQQHLGAGMKCQKSSSKTSIYQLIADAASSSHQRSKIHPKASLSEQQLASGRRHRAADDDDDDDDDGEDDDDDDTNERHTGDPESTDQNEPESQQERERGLLVDVATSPINFPAPNGEQQQSQQQQRLKTSPERPAQASTCSLASPASPEPEDFETRIVSYGNKFTFETNDPKLVGSSQTGASGGDQSCSKQRCCKPSMQNHILNRSSTRWNHPNQHHHHHVKSASHLPAGKQSSSACCCADVISTHDAECRLCRPNRRPEQQLANHQHSAHAHPHHSHAHHRHHHHHHHHHHHGQRHHAVSGHHGHHHHHSHNHHHHHHHQSQQQHHLALKLDCKRCLQQKQQQQQQHPPANRSTPVGGQERKELYKQNIKPEQALSLEVDSMKGSLNGAPPAQGDSLPILNALQQQQQQRQQPSDGAHQSNRPTKSGKKFSQKLTFSDILIERSNSCVTIESALQTTGSTKSKSPAANNGSLAGAKHSSKRNPSGLKDASQDIVRRNADRLRSAFDDDLDEDDSPELAQRSKPPTTATSGRNWFECLLLGMFRSRNRPVRYKTNYRGSDQIEDEAQRRTMRRGRWMNSICCAQSRNNGPVLKRSSPRTSDELDVYQKDQQTDSSSNSANDQQNQHHHQQQQQHLQKSGASSQHSSTSSSKAQQCHHYHPIQPKSERKAAKTLSTLLLVFIVTWLPYNVLVLIKTLSGGEDQVPEKIWNFSYYLCYINSTINPLCYALCNAQFRRTYMRILKCKLSNEHNSTRRLVPIQSSSTWNKDLRLNSTSAADCSTNSTMSHQQLQHHHHHLQQVAKTAESQRHRPRDIQERPSKNTSSSDSSAVDHHH